MTERTTDEELMRRYRDGELRAFELLYARHKAPLYRYFLRLVAPSAVAEELFQDVWMNLIRARATYQVRARFTTWLYRLAHNRLVDHYRRSAAGMPLSYDDRAQAAMLEVPDARFREPDNALERQRLVQRFLQQLAALPEAQREAFLLREEGGLSLEQIAAASGVSMETAKSRLRYAVAKLREGMTRAEDIVPAPLRGRDRT